MDNTTMMLTMDVLCQRFHKEVKNIDALHPDIKCDMTFLKRYIKAHDYYTTCMMLPEDHPYKNFYSNKLTDTLVELGVEF